MFGHIYVQCTYFFSFYMFSSLKQMFHIYCCYIMTLYIVTVRRELFNDV